MPNTTSETTVPDHSSSLPQTTPSTQALTDWLDGYDGHDLLAIVLSFCLPGGGHFLIGQHEKGLFVLVTTIVMFASAICCFPAFFVVIAVPPLAIADTLMTVRAKRVRPVGPWEFFPTA